VAWITGGLALYVVIVRISFSSPVTSDGANIALQAWEMLHGHLLLHGWITADASFYTFELPLAAIAESLFGLHTAVCHLASALTYLIVVAFGVALACTNSRGPAVAARCAVVVAVLTAPLITQPGVAILLEAPDHIGTAAFLLGCCLLVDRAAGRGCTPPLLLLILCAGQIGDATVLFVAVPTILLVCAYRLLTDRKIRTADAAIAVAAAGSVPLAMLARAAMRYLGGYAIVPPRTEISSPGQWGHHALVTLQDIRTLFGSTAVDPGTAPGAAASAFGWACLLAAAFGLVKVIWTWRRASRAEQLLCVAILANVAVYIISTMATTTSAREIAAVLPCGAVLAARGCIPGRIPGAQRARGVALAAAALAAVVPLAAAAAQPPATQAAVPLAAWLEAHRYAYGIAGYWDASPVTLQSGNRVTVRAVNWQNEEFVPYYWETKPQWYASSRHRATFVIADPIRAYPYDDFTAADVEQYFGRPAAIYRVTDHEILVYRKNLLRRLAAPFVPSPTGKTE